MWQCQQKVDMNLRTLKLTVVIKYRSNYIHRKRRSNLHLIKFRTWVIIF